MIRYLYIALLLTAVILITGCSDSDNVLANGQLYENADTDHDLEVKSIGLHVANLSDAF